MSEFNVLRVYRVSLIVFMLFLSLSLCLNGEDSKTHGDEEEDLEIDFDSNDLKEIFDPFDLLNYDRQKMLERTKKKPVLDSVDSNFDPFDPLDLNRKQILKDKNNADTDIGQRIQTTDYSPQDLVDGSSVSTQHISGLNEISEGKIPETKYEQKTVDSIEDKCICEKEIQNCDDPVEARERPILRRFVQSLYKTLSLEHIHLEDGEVLHFTLSAKITQRAHGILHDIVSSDGDIKKKKLADLDEILFYLFELEKKPPNDSISFSLLEFVNNINMHPKDWIPVLFVSYLCIIFVMLSQRRSILAIFATSAILFICVSWYWHWHYLYQQSLSKRQSDAIKYSEMPPSCTPAQLNSLEAAFVWFSNFLPGEDPCEKYHEILMTDPVYQVTPLTALSDTLATAIFHPLGYIGHQIGLFFNGILDASHWYAKIPVFVCVVFLLVVLLVLGCGYEIHMPLFMGSLKPAVRQEARALDSINAPQVETITLTSEQRGPGTPPQPIMVLLKVVTDSMGDSKVQKITELAIDSTPMASSTIDRIIPESTVELIPSIEFSNTDLKIDPSDVIGELSKASDELEPFDANEIANKNDGDLNRKEE